MPSFGFSGAGFLACYHLGATKCLLENGQLELDDASFRPVLTGVSGGALNIAAIAAGVDPEAGMQTALLVAERTRQEGVLDAFRPGFSLLDQVEERILKDMRTAVNGDDELFLRRIEGGKYLRIGLAERLTEFPLRNPNAYCYVDEYRDIEDVVAACMLSSFVPGVTGPLAWSSPTISRASKRVKEMLDLGFIKKQRPNGEIVTVRPSSDSKVDSKPENYKGDFPYFLDGGLSNAFPVIDEKTVVVTPMCGVFDPNPSISPDIDLYGKHPNTKSENVGDVLVAKQKGSSKLLKVSDRVKLHLNRQNAYTMRRIVLSSDEDNLQRRYSQGYDDARRFLEDNNLLSSHSSNYFAMDPSLPKKK